MAVAVLLCSSCVQQLVDIDDVALDLASELRGVQRLDTAAFAHLSGVYRVEVGGGVAADSVALLWSGDEGSVLGEANALWCSLRGGLLGDTVKIVGTWRFTQGTSIGIMRLTVLPDEGGTALARGSNPGKDLVLRGTVSDASGGSVRPFVMRRRTNLRARLRGFWVIGHRGGARNSDRLGVSENTVEMIQLAPRLGCNAVEIDVVRTRDGVPIVFHDERFTPRTVQGAYILGLVENYTAQQIRAAARLVHGERIPTLHEVLDATMEQRRLGLVWVDVKQRAVLDSVLHAMVGAQQRARLKGRNDLRFLVGLPTAEIARSYMEHPLRSQVEAICELSTRWARDVEAEVWAPRWTAGLQLDEVQAMQREQRLCFTWTLDDPVFMNEFVTDGEFDGILTNYPTLLAAKYYTRRGRQ